MGFVGADPEQRQARNNGSKFTVLSVATQRSWKNAEDEWVSKVEWHRIGIFRPRLAESVLNGIRKGAHVLVGLLLFSRPAWAQAPADSPALQAILNELRQIHQDLRTTSIVAQRSQILLYRLQSQEAAVARASQRLDDARAKLAEVQGNQKKTAAQIQDYRNWMRDNSENATATQKKNMEDAIAQFQAKLEAQGSEEQQRQSREIEADQQFRLEQAKLTALQDQLDQLERELQSPAHSAK